MAGPSLATIRDVAREARVAVSTVSRVINGSGYTSAATRARVLAAATRLGYRPSGTARGLRRARTMTLGVLIPDLANPVFVELLRGAEHGAQAHGYALLICDAQHSEELTRTHLARLYEHRVDGLLLGALAPREALAPFIAARIPMTPRNVRPPGLEEAAGLAAYQRLIALGHRRIAFVGRDLARGDLPERRQTWAMALTAAGAAPDPDLIADLPSTDCGPAVARLEALPDPPTAYVVATHVLVPGLLTAIYAAGRRIPEERSFISYGDSPWALAHRPPLAVIRHDYYAEARATAEWIIARIEGWPEPPRIHAYPSHFIERGSLGHKE